MDLGTGVGSSRLASREVDGLDSGEAGGLELAADGSWLAVASNGRVPAVAAGLRWPRTVAGMREL